MYEDTSGLLNKEGNALRWGNVYQVFKRHKFSTNVEDQDELKIFKKIINSRIFIVATHVLMFHCSDAITWILKHADLENMYDCNSRRDHIASFQPE
jgi:hypothetical protein